MPVRYSGDGLEVRSFPAANKRGDDWIREWRLTCSPSVSEVDLLRASQSMEGAHCEFRLELAGPGALLFSVRSTLHAGSDEVMFDTIRAIQQLERIVPLLEIEGVSRVSWSGYFPMPKGI